MSHDDRPHDEGAGGSLPTRQTLTRDGGPAAVHDIGGLDFGPIDRAEHDLALWERRVDAMMILMYAKRSAFTVDAMRRTIEDYGQQAYDATTYYEKWVRALRNLMVEQEVASRAEIEAALARARDELAASGRTIAPGSVSWSELERAP